MNRIASKLTIALFAAAGLGGTALAAETAAKPAHNADKTQVVPSRDDLQPGNPSLSSMDDNAQRPHDNDRDGNTSTPNTSTSYEAGSGNAGQAAAGDAATRDWNAIDTNNDNLIQPAEMEVALEAVGPQAKTAQ
ncbi:MAG: hypothetical protein H0W40_02825 [Methylibium sp.]|uniref:hypothetical protein n=1 Tax=Methylibium sp. TaxID=2067992 RepID=UPI00183DECDE|nr:hypothetical protein [Methylibium sp.]MBA3596296.1 hypothetical protein [Methylibium sp.]